MVGGACSADASQLSNRIGDCAFAPNAQCANQDLGAVTVPSTDLTGADFTGSDFRRADLRYTILRNATLAGADLSEADLTGSDLRGADLSGAVLFSTSFNDARWEGSNRSGARYCETLFPDGSVSDCVDLDVKIPLSSVTPPSVVRFAPRAPVRCFHDALGQGIEVDWVLRDALSAGFLVDGIQASSATGSRGINRIPFPCDRKSHRVTIQGFGSVSPLASSSFSLTLGPGTASEPVR